MKADSKLGLWFVNLLKHSNQFNSVESKQNIEWRKSINLNLALLTSIQKSINRRKKTFQNRPSLFETKLKWESILKDKSYWWNQFGVMNIFVSASHRKTILKTEKKYNSVFFRLIGDKSTDLFDFSKEAPYNLTLYTLFFWKIDKMATEEILNGKCWSPKEHLNIFKTRWPMRNIDSDFFMLAKKCCKYSKIKKSSIFQYLLW